MNAKVLAAVAAEDTADALGARRVDRRTGSDPVFVRRGMHFGRPVLEVLDSEGDRRFWLPAAIATLPTDAIDELVTALADQQDADVKRCIRIGQLQKEAQLRQAIGAVGEES
jgi:hypothetical protein